MDTTNNITSSSSSSEAGGESLCSNVTSWFPFEFFDMNGSVISEGEVTEDGLCIFPEANCHLDSPIDGCCRAKDGVIVTGGNYMFIAFVFIFLPYIYLTTCAFSGYKEEEKEKEDDDGDDKEEEQKEANKDETNKKEEQPQKETATSEDDKEEDTTTTDSRRNNDDDSVPSWVRAIPIPGFAIIFSLGLWFSITLQIMIPIWMKSSLQSKLDVASRNALIAGEAFIVPYKEIFQFIEDIVLVRVNYAMARGQKKRTDQLVHAGMAGTLFTGIVAAVLGSILGAIPPVLQTLTNPGVDNDMEVLYPGCNLIMEDNDLVFPYWLMEVWAIPGTQLGMVISGFLLGAMELPTLGWIASISVSLIPIIWFSSVDDASNRLLLLSTAEFASAWALPVLSITYIMCPLGRDLREKTGVSLHISKLCSSFGAFAVVIQQQQQTTEEEDGKDTNNHQDDDPDHHPPKPKDSSSSTSMKDHDGHTEPEITQNGDHHVDANAKPSSTQPPEEEEEEESTSALLFEGLKIMVMDVVIQCCISISVYLALANDAAEGYKLTALQSALPAYGTAYAVGMGVMFKIAGPQILTAGAYRVFATLARLMVVCAYMLVPLILGAVLPFREGLAFDTGGNACAYAKDEQCLPFFTKVFGENASGGDFTLPFTFNFFSLGAAAEAVFFVLRATLLTLVDLDFMLKATGIAVLFYIPSIIVASNVQPFAAHASAYFVAMYIPQIVLIVFFTVRIEVLIRRILRGEQGGWSSGEEDKAKQQQNRRISLRESSTRISRRASANRVSREPSMRL